MICKEVIFPPFQGIMEHTYNKAPDEDTLLIIEGFYMFDMRIFYYKNSDPGIIVIKYNNSDKTTAQKLHNKELNDVVTRSVLHVVLHHYVLSWIIKNNKKLRFEIEHHCDRLMQKILRIIQLFALD